MNIPLQHAHPLYKNIIDAEKQFGRESHSVTLLAVSKNQTSKSIYNAYLSGQKAFGENYVQEALPKIQILNQHYPDNHIEWHFIGPIQSNKTKAIAENFSWVHSIDRIKIAQRLHEHRPDNLPPLNICIQINISREPAKSGILPDLDNILEFIQNITSLSKLRLRGLMALPAPSSIHDFTAQRKPFHTLASFLKMINQTQYPKLDTLSMGTSDDYIAAIAEGATIIRLGRSFFGERLNKKC